MAEKEHANKCESEFENPIDNFLCATLPYVRPYFHNMGFSANGITYLSIIFGFGSAYLLYKENFIYAAVLYAISYYLDCLDGNYARYYKDYSVLGDYLDHYSDLAINGVILYLLVIHFGIDNRITALLVFLLGMMYLHVGLQEKYYNTSEKSESMGGFIKDIGLNKDWIHITKLFGCGTFTLVMTLLIANMDVILKYKG